MLQEMIACPSWEEILSEEFVNSYSNRQPDWYFGTLSYVVYKRSYARLKENGTTEEWHETIARAIRGAQKIGAKYTREEAERLFDHIFHLRCCFSGRGLWQLGTATVDKFGMDSLLNCWGTKTSEISDFIFIIIESMLGGGVGCSLAKEFTHELPRVKNNVHVYQKNTRDADFIVPDSKEGWSELSRKILEAFLLTGKGFSYSPICIRSSGEPIKTFGGIAPGPQPLMEYAKDLVELLQSRSGKKLRTQDVADMITLGGQMVKSGGVRRTALIFGGDVDDLAYLSLKRWDLGTIPNHRSNSNNSLLCPKFDYLPDKFWAGYNGNGEAYGLLNLPLARKYGRLGETSWEGFSLTNNDIIIFNPCAEATLEDKECCNLATLNINKIASVEEMMDCAKLLYKAQKAIAAGPYIFPETNKVVHKNMRLGLSVTGICQKLNVFEDWCDQTYRELRRFDKEWSAQNGWPQSIRLTVIQPNGTLGSLVLGSTPGAHTGYARFTIRRVRFDAKDPLVARLKKAGYSMEPEIKFDGKYNHDIMVVDFPTRFSDDTLVAEQSSAIDQLERVKKLQTCWADQAVSATIYYKPEELDGIKEWLKQNYDNSIKSISFLLHQDHNFKQAPYEPISEEMYNKLIQKLKPLDHGNDSGGEIDSQECSNGACPIR